MNEALLTQACSAFEAVQRILIVSHIRPDGDAIGSLFGLGLALQNAGKDVQMVLADGLPASFRFLEGAKQVRTSPQGPFDLSVVVDCSDMERIGNAANGVFINGVAPDINIDHHITNLNFARLNLVDTEATATAEVLAELLPACGLSISPGTASALLTGIVTDTLGFRTENVRPETLCIAAKLMEAGANLHKIYRHSLINRSFKATRYWGAGLSNLERDGQMVWATLKLTDRQAVSYPGRDDADLINVISEINEGEISLIFVEQTGGRVKVSWRSQPGYDVSQIALCFGGGGHKAAAGAEISGSLDEVKQSVLQATRALLNSR